MKWNLAYIQKNAKPNILFEEKISFDSFLINKLSGVKKIENVLVSGKLKYIDSISQCIIDFEVTGVMKMQCAISNEDVDFEFSDQDSISFTFNYKEESDELIYAKGNIIDLIPYIWQLIVVNVPLRVVKEGAKLKNLSGKNWKIGENREKKEEVEKPIDPRLESLKNYFDKH